MQYPPYWGLLAVFIQPVQIMLMKPYSVMAYAKALSFLQREFCGVILLAPEELILSPDMQYLQNLSFSSKQTEKILTVHRLDEIILFIIYF